MWKQALSDGEGGGAYGPNISPPPLQDSTNTSTPVAMGQNPPGSDEVMMGSVWFDIFVFVSIFLDVSQRVLVVYLSFFSFSFYRLFIKICPLGSWSRGR